MTGRWRSSGRAGEGEGRAMEGRRTHFFCSQLFGIDSSSSLHSLTASAYGPLKQTVSGEKTIASAPSRLALSVFSLLNI